MRNVLIYILSTGLVLTMSMHAETLANWDLKGQDGFQDETNLSGSPAEGVTASAIVRGPGYDKQGNAGEFSSDTMSFSPKAAINALEEAIAAQAYFEVTLAPEQGYSLSIRAVVFSCKRATQKSGPNSFVVRTSLDNFETDAAGPIETKVPEGGDVTVSFGTELSKLTQPVTLRFYGFGRTIPDYPGHGFWAIYNSPTTGGFTIEGQIYKR